jgi:hypothetical protein
LRAANVPASLDVSVIWIPLVMFVTVRVTFALLIRLSDHENDQVHWCLAYDVGVAANTDAVIRVEAIIPQTIISFVFFIF